MLSLLRGKALLMLEFGKSMRLGVIGARTSDGDQSAPSLTFCDQQGVLAPCLCRAYLVGTLEFGQTLLVLLLEFGQTLLMLMLEDRQVMFFGLYHCQPSIVRLELSLIGARHVLQPSEMLMLHTRRETLFVSALLLSGKALLMKTLGQFTGMLLAAALMRARILRRMTLFPRIAVRQAPVAP